LLSQHNPIHFENKGAKNEGNIFGETLIRLAKECKVKIPITTEVYESLLAR